MKHKHIQKRLLLFLDGDLPQKEMRDIFEHLSQCRVCSQKYDAIVSLWNMTEPMGKASPPSHLWNKVQENIRHDEGSPRRRLWTVSTVFPIVILRPIPALILIISILLGLYLGTPPKAPDKMIAQRSNLADELGLDHFDMIPPEALGIALADYDE